jgi:hypothetical protein
MFSRLIPLLFIACGPVLAAGESPQWMKLGDALNLSARDGRPIAVLVSVNPNGSS